jgi:hypothetical protein
MAEKVTNLYFMVSGPDFDRSIPDANIPLFHSVFPAYQIFDDGNGNETLLDPNNSDQPAPIADGSLRQRIMCHHLLPQVGMTNGLLRRLTRESLRNFIDRTHEYTGPTNGPRAALAGQYLHKIVLPMLFVHALVDEINNMGLTELVVGNPLQSFPLNQVITEQEFNDNFDANDE